MDKKQSNARILAVTVGVAAVLACSVLNVPEFIDANLFKPALATTAPAP